MNDLILHGKTILLTGAARRIGAVTATTLHHAGASVVIHYRHAATEALALQQQLNAQRANSCFLVQADLLQVTGFTALMAQVLSYTGRLDGLINNASSFYPTAIGDLTEAQWDDLLGTNLKVPIFLAQAAASYLKLTQGNIINLIDVHGIRPLNGYVLYSAAKAGLLMATQVLARDLGPDIRVNGIAPGAILWPEQGTNETNQRMILEKTALKRAGTPHDIAQAILFLLTAPYITGQILSVDGGRLLNH